RRQRLDLFLLGELPIPLAGVPRRGSALAGRGRRTGPATVPGLVRVRVRELGSGASSRARAARSFAGADAAGSPPPRCSSPRRAPDVRYHPTLTTSDTSCAWWGPASSIG